MFIFVFSTRIPLALLLCSFLFLSRRSPRLLLGAKRRTTDIDVGQAPNPFSHTAVSNVTFGSG